MRSLSGTKKIYFLMIAVLVILAGMTVGAVVLGSKLLQKKGDELMAQKLDNATLESRQAALKKAKQDIRKYEPEEALAKTIVPQEKNQAATVNQIVSLATATNVRLSSISFPTSNLGQAAPKPVATTDGGTTTPKPATPSETQVKPVDGIKGVYQLEVNLQSDTSSPSKYEDLLRFLSALESEPSIGQVSSVVVQPTPKDRSIVNFTIILNVYIKL
jgi:hypothetical protein